MPIIFSAECVCGAKCKTAYFGKYCVWVISHIIEHKTVKEGIPVRAEYNPKEDDVDETTVSNNPYVED